MRFLFRINLDAYLLRGLDLLDVGWRVGMALQFSVRRYAVHAIGETAMPTLVMLHQHSQTATLGCKARYLVFISVAPMLRGKYLFGQLAYLIGLVTYLFLLFVQRFVLLRYAFRQVFLYVKVLVERLLLVVNLHVQSLHLGLVGVMLDKFGLRIVLALTRRQDKVKHDVADKAYAGESEYK